MRRFVLLMAMAAVSGLAMACGGGGSSTGSSPAAPAVAFNPVATGIVAPTVITHANDGSGRLFIVEQGGTIRIMRNGSLLVPPFLDISARLLSDGERGLLGLAFPPNFSAKGYFYVNYTRAPDGATVLSRFFVSPDPDLALATGEEVLLEVAQPFANHNGGQLAFGPDGFLYVGLGDGGSGGDPRATGRTSPPCWASCCASMSRPASPPTKSLLTTPFSATRAPAPRSGPAACATPGVFPLTGSPAIFSWPMSGKTPGRRSTSSPRPQAAAPITAGTSSKARIASIPLPAAWLPRPTRLRSLFTAMTSAVR